jgi:hypothetical protein
LRTYPKHLPFDIIAEAVHSAKLKIKQKRKPVISLPHFSIILPIDSKSFAHSLNATIMVFDIEMIKKLVANFPTVKAARKIVGRLPSLFRKFVHPPLAG